MCIIPSVYRESGQSAGVPVCWGYLAYLLAYCLYPIPFFINS